MVFQKVIKAPLADPKSPSSASPGGGNPLFLGCLVEYLQDHFTLPEKLPMVYEVRPVLDDEKSVASWDSPMSSSSDATRLDLEVIALYTDNEEDDDNNNAGDNTIQNVAPSMAMVVVRKASLDKSNTAKLPSPMMRNLFDDSEQRILRALDRGLDDFMAGKISLASLANAQQDYRERQKQQKEFQKAQDAMIEEMLQDAAEDHPSVLPNNKGNQEEEQRLKDKTKNVQKVLDADFSKVEEKDLPQSKASDDDHRQTSNTVKQAPSLDTGLDFAIQAAKRAAAAAAKNKEKKKQAEKQLDNDDGKPKITLDFAVAAAQKVSKTLNKQRMTTTNATTTTSSGTAPSKATPARKSPSEGTSTTRVASNGGDDAETIPSDFKISAPNDGRAFRATFSSPKAFAAKQKAKQTSQARSTSSATTAKTTKVEETKSTLQSPATSESSTTSSQQQSAETTSKGGPKRKLNLKIVDDDEGLYPGDKKVGDTETLPPVDTAKGKTTKASKTESGDQSSSSSSQDQKTPTRKFPTQEDIMKTSQQVMAEIADQGLDMSAEEMLQDVLKFGDKQEQQDKVGSGFVSGAFETAKELLREQKQNREKRIAAEAQKETTNKEAEGPQVKTREISSEEEELRKMFEAGERLADGRISLAAPEKDVPTGTMTEEDEQLVDELVAGDKSVSSHARIIDDELAELEVQIRRTPGEELDGATNKYPLFDVFSGPEVYNPNVDPESAVNWPGATPGSKSMAAESKLPKELNEAIKQAKFASEILHRIEEREVEGVNDKKTYFVGERELSEEQVENLLEVVNEAVEIGIIQNPLVLMEERSRLQMVVDELWSQPEDRLREVLVNYKDLLLSDNFVPLIKERLQAMAARDLDALRKRTDDDDTDVELEQKHAREREILGQLVENAQLLLKEAKAMGAALEAQQLEVIRSICKVAMDPSHVTEEETAAALTEAVKDMRPLFDEMFVSYLKYAVAEEEGRLARAGLLDDPDHNQWLFVLKIVQHGVYAEISKGINRYVEHIWYVLRMETAKERKMLLEKLIDVLPTLDVRPFVRVVDNIVGSLGEVAKGEFAADGAYELGKMSNKLLQLHRDVKELLPPDRIDEMSRDADEWAAKRKERMLEQRRLTRQRIAAARDTEEYDEEIESMGRRGGEMERFD